MSAQRFSSRQFFIAVVSAAILYICRAAFIPIALALLLSLLLSGPVERLHALHIPRGISAAGVLLLLIGSLLGSANLLWSPAQQCYHAAPDALQVVKTRLKPVAAFVRHAEELGSLTETGVAAATSAPPEAGPALSNPTNVLLDATKSIVGATIACLVTTLFLLIGGPPMVARMTVALVADIHAFHVMQLIDQVRAAVGQFYLTTALLNVVLGAATAASMSLLGMPSPLLWGALASVLMFVPYAGSTVVLGIITAVALVTFDSPARVISVSVSYLAIATIGGQIVQPLLIGQRLEINPLVVFLSLWFGLLFWGISGMVLAMPTLLTLKVVAQNARGGRRLREFLKPNDRSVLRQPLINWWFERRSQADDEAVSNLSERSATIDNPPTTPAPAACGAR